MAPEDEVARLTRENARLKRALERAQIELEQLTHRSGRLQAQLDFEHGRTPEVRERGQRLLAMFKEAT